jgi:hypothetical protein
MASGKNIVVGVDLGRLVDHSAVSVVEHIAEITYDPFPGPHEGHTGADCPCHEIITHRYGVLELHKFPLLTSYSTVITDIGQMLSASGLEDALLAIDCTGIGRAIYLMFTNAKDKGRLGRFYPIPYVIAGSGETGESRRGFFRVLKVDLVAKLIEAMEGDLIDIPASLHDAAHLERELSNFRRKVTQKGAQTYAAEGTREHDDLVTATMLAIFRENTYTQPRRMAAPEIAAKA